MKKRIAFLLCFFLPVLGSFGEKLYVPPLLEGRSALLVMEKGTLKLPAGRSESYGYNGDYLGPTLHFNKGDQADVRVLNRLNEDSTLHWHGMHIPAEFDGGPHQIIPAGAEWNPRFEIRQDAATLWYHPHLMGKTGEQVYKGLAGMIIIDDDFSQSLSIPREYGVNDIPLILQDRRILRNGKIVYAPGMHDVMTGYTGNILLTNGQVSPDLRVSGGTVRFRVLNGSNSTLMRIRMEGGGSFRVIASDGGFLPESVEMNELILSPGERYEILADFSKAGTYTILTDLYGSETFRALTVHSDGKGGVPLPAADAADRPARGIGGPAVVEREFRMETRGMGGFSINGKRMDMNRIDFSPRQGVAEVWTVLNVPAGMMNIFHSFHVHDVQFVIESINGSPPPPHLAGPKDTVLIYPGESIRIILKFEDYTGIYMYHCHFLEHEDNGMMGQFEVVAGN